MTVLSSLSRSSQVVRAVGRTVWRSRGRCQLLIPRTCLIAVASLTCLPHLRASEPTPGPPKGWVVLGPAAGAFLARLDSAEKHSGRGSALLHCATADLDTFGTLTQKIRADDYRGRRIRLSGYLRTRDLELWASLWMRVDGAKRSPLAFDNMWKRPVRGNTEWSSYKIVLDVPQSAVQIAYGAILAGRGKLWVDDVTVEVVSEAMPTTDMRAPPVATKTVVATDAPSNPVNAGFEE